MSFVRDARGNVINGLRVQKAKNRNGKTIDRFYALYRDRKRKHFGNSENKRGAILRYRQSNAWGRSRFGTVKTIINRALVEMDVRKDDRAVLVLRWLLDMAALSTVKYLLPANGSRTILTG